MTFTGDQLETIEVIRGLVGENIDEYEALEVYEEIMYY